MERRGEEEMKVNGYRRHSWTRVDACWWSVRNAEPDGRSVRMLASSGTACGRNSGISSPVAGRVPPSAVAPESLIWIQRQRKKRRNPNSIMKTWKHEILNFISLRAPEESVVFDAEFPQSLSCTMVGQFEADGRFVLFKFARANLDVESVASVRNLQDLGPSEPVDTQSETHPLNFTIFFWKIMNDVYLSL